MLINYDVLVDLSTSVVGPTHFRNTQRVFFFNADSVEFVRSVKDSPW